MASSLTTYPLSSQFVSWPNSGYSNCPISQVNIGIVRGTLPNIAPFSEAHFIHTTYRELTLLPSSGYWLSLYRYVLLYVVLVTTVRIEPVTFRMIG
jgi:hypothetical protein